MKDLITEARELCGKATPGEWEVNHLDDCFIEPRICEIPANGCYDYKMVEANSMFIARSRTLIPELCDALERAEAECEQMKTAISSYCRNDCYRDACTGNEDVGIPDCPMAKYAPPLPAAPEEGEME